MVHVSEVSPNMIDYRTGDALELMRELPDATADLVACSPPFLALRNYNDLDGQWGSEANPAAFLDTLLTLATETRRVLSPHGSIAWELGDTYSGSGPGGQPSGTAESRDINGRREKGLNGKRIKRSADGWPLAKSLTGIPTLFAWSLAYGRNLLNPVHTFDPWRIRNIIVWSRNNPPVGALGDKYRPACSYITVATVAKDRWFDLDAVRTEHADPKTEAKRSLERLGTKAKTLGTVNGSDGMSNPAGAPPLDHWHDTETLDWFVNGQPSKLAHYAMWPPKLAERLILSMCPAEVCRTCNEPRRRIVESHRFHRGQPIDGIAIGGGERMNVQQITGANGQNTHTDRQTIGWSDCGHNDFRPGMVLDPFAGTGTTLAVAEIHGRNAIGFDLDPANPGLYPARLAECRRALYGTPIEPPGTMTLFDERATT